MFFGYFCLLMTFISKSIKKSNDNLRFFLYTFLCSQLTTPYKKERKFYEETQKIIDYVTRTCHACKHKLNGLCQQYLRRSLYKHKFRI